MSKEIGINKTNSLNGSIIFHFRCFLEIRFRFLLEVSSGYRDLMPKVMSSTDVNIVSVKGNDYKINLMYMSKHETTNILEILIRQYNTICWELDLFWGFFVSS